MCVYILFFQGMENLKIIQSWFKVDIKPYKMSLLNNIKRWSFAFKKHLMDHVVTSLGELNSFIERADEGLMTQVKENDYNGLIAGIFLQIFQFLLHFHCKYCILIAMITFSLQLVLFYCNYCIVYCYFIVLFLYCSNGISTSCQRKTKYY